MQLEELINQHYHELNENDKKLCQKILSHKSMFSTF